MARVSCQLESVLLYSSPVRVSLLEDEAEPPQARPHQAASDLDPGPGLGLGLGLDLGLGLEVGRESPSRAASPCLQLRGRQARREADLPGAADARAAAEGPQRRRRPPPRREVASWAAGRPSRPGEAEAKRCPGHREGRRVVDQAVAVAAGPR